MDKRKQDPVYSRAYYAKNREKILAYQKAYAAKNRELLRAKAKARRLANLESEREKDRARMPERLEWRRAWAEQNRDKLRQYSREFHARDRMFKKRAHLKSQYGITWAEYQAIIAAQGGVCAICQQEPQPMKDGRTGWHVDHCHEENKVRGLLCGNCNTGIGKFKDDPERLRAAAEYLEDRRLVACCS